MSQVLLYFYLFISLVLIFLSLNCYVMFYLFKRKQKEKRAAAKDFKIDLDDYPTVTTQIAIYNELNVAERVIEAVVAMEYPKGKHHIQVVDDSTDETYDLIAGIVTRLKGDGVLIEHLHRVNRKGYKAGALAEAVEKCKTDYVAIFDADFVPHKDYLLKAIPHFLRGEKIGLVQSRWGHLNRNESLITRVQSLGIDGHFAVEQSSRDWNNLYMNFNGTAGIMSLQAIKDGGGWSDDTLTEDMDLSYRMQIAGWRTHYLVDVECPAEVPSDMNAFKSQQFRWAKGSMQTALKIVPKVLKDPHAGLFKKYQALMHTTHYMIHPLMLLTALLAWPVATLNGYTADTKSVGWLYISLFICFSAPGLIYITSQKTLFKDWLKNLTCYPALMFIGSGLCISNSKAVWEALTGKVSGFVRTPKKGDKEAKHYTVKIPVVPFAEVAAGLYCGLSLRYFLVNEQYVASFFIGLYSVGFMFNGILSLVHNGFLGEVKKATLNQYGLSAVVLVVLSYFLGTTETGSGKFTLLYLAIGGGMLWAWKSVKGFSSAHLFILFITAILTRYYMLPFAVSDDLFRYIWEGHILASGFDPYVLSPDSSALTHLIDDHWSGINHKNWTAIYGPVAMLIFKVMSQFQSSPEFFKLVFVGFDLAVMYVLYKILSFKGLNLKGLIFYAVNPLILVSFAGEGHLDVLQIFFVLCAFWAQGKKSFQLAALFLGLAIGIKFTSILFLPFLIRKENFYAIIFSIVSFLFPVFYLDISLVNIFDSLFKFGIEMQFNDSLHYILSELVGGSIGKLMSLVILAAFVAGYWLTQDNPLRGALLTMIAFLLLSPTVHPWYLAIAVALAIIVRSPLVILWSISSVFYFAVYVRLREDLVFSHSVQDQALQYIPVFLALGYMFYRKMKGQRTFVRTAPEGSISVLIPVLNESDNASQIMEDLQSQTYKAQEVLVIDGGSIDGTAESFKAAGARVLHCCDRGRGNQLSYGLEQAMGDYVVILHADKRLNKFSLESVASSLDLDPKLIGGAIGASFDSKQFKYKIIEFLNNLRMALCGISFGDQGQFFRREIVLKNGLLHKIPLMEDVELALGLQAQGKVVKLHGGLNVSTRRWRKKKVLSNSFEIFFLLIKYLFLRRTYKSVQTDKFYESYYSEKPVVKV